MLRKPGFQVLAVTGLWFAFTATGKAQTVGPHALITQAIDENRLVTLAGNTRQEANLRYDAGRVANDLHLDMYLQLKRSPEQELAAKLFVESLTDKSSPNFHKWITAAEYGERFGATAADIATVSRWLEAHGFTVNGVPANKMVIDLSGTAGLVSEALHTEIHYLDVGGERHFANMSDPQIPAALLPAVTGVVSLHNFRPHAIAKIHPQYTLTYSNLPFVPGDLATVYNLNAAFAAGYTGQGQTIVVLEDSDLYNGTGDWAAFRNTFGLNQYPYGSLTQIHPAPGSGGSCSDPGTTSDDVEAALDVEWASAAAPNAAIVLASCADSTVFGEFIALQNLLTNGGPLPGIVSISYGESETQAGAALNSYINTLYQTAAAGGISVFVATGDAGAAQSDHGGSTASNGITVSALASTVYNVAVGGTDFSDFPSGTTREYWNSTPGTYYNYAKSYVPEIPWNISCASAIYANWEGFSEAYGPNGFCNVLAQNVSTEAGSGGPSGCAMGAATQGSAVSGTCAGYGKPSWQSVFGNPSDGVRDLPDVALFASAGMWRHYYPICLSSYVSCSAPLDSWPETGGTSASTPVMAGIQALINQALGFTNAGNPNPVYYEIGRSEYSTPAGRAACNSAGPASTCSFYDITQGDMVVPCTGAFNCYLDGAAIGVLSTSDTSYQPAYAASYGWDFATGMGSVNAFNLLNAFVDAMAPSQAPAAPALASPANFATGVSPTPVLSWNASTGATSYDVYFGTTSTPPLVENTESIDYVPGTLAPGVKYYWAIGARNGYGANVSTPWSFTTDCVAVLNPSSLTAPLTGGTGTLPVTAAAGCAWTASSTATWITITSGASGPGSGTVGYSVAANTGAQRTGTITVAGQTATLTQAGYFPVISTLAGGIMPPTPSPGTALSIPLSSSFDGGAPFQVPSLTDGIAVDSNGSVFFSSPGLNAVFKVDSTGAVTRIAGTGFSGKSGEGLAALSAQLSSPNGIAVDSQDNVYIADTNNHRVLKVNASGVITTVAGAAFAGYSGDHGPAVQALLRFPCAVAVDSKGNLYIADTYNQVIREVNTAGIITTLAGNGVRGSAGDNGPATSAEFFNPVALALDSQGNLYIADSDNQRIRKVDTSGKITTFAGGGSCCGLGDGGAATSAQLYIPSGLAADTLGNIYIADTYNQRVRQVNAAGTITTVAGNGAIAFFGDGGAATSAALWFPQGVAIDGNGNLYIADTGNARIRQVQAGKIGTLVGGGTNDGGLGVFGPLNQPSAVARDNAGNTYIADTNNNRVRKVAANGTITTVAGTGTAGFGGDGAAAASALLNQPQGLAVDGSGNLYISDTYNRRVRKVSLDGTITSVAGNGGCCYGGDGGPATSAVIGIPTGLAVDPVSGNLYIADNGSYVVRKVTPSGTISTYAGTGSYGYSGDGFAATSAELAAPAGLAVDTGGNLYIADQQNYRVRMVSTGGIITTVAGNGSCCYAGDGGPATSAKLNEPAGVAVDLAGNLYIADLDDNVVREVSGGIITTIAGISNGDTNPGYSGDGGLASAAVFNGVAAVAADNSGNVAVIDLYNNAVRLLTPSNTLPVLTIQSVHAGAFVSGQNAAYSLTVSDGQGAGPTSGLITVAEILPAGLTPVSMEGAGWGCSVSTCTRSDVLSGGSSYPPITVTVNVSASAPTQFTNEVSVTGGGGNVAGVEDFTVIAVLQSIAVTPANPSIAKGLTQQFTATGTYSDDSMQDLTSQVTWASVSTSVATISTGGLATAATVGGSTTTATLGSVQGSTIMTVTAPALVSIAVTPANPSIAKGLTQQFTATGTYTDNSTLSLDGQVTWTSATTSVATITASGGLATGAGVGPSTISATLSGIVGWTVLTVTPAVLQSIAVTPANPSIAKGLTQQFTATGIYTDSSTQNLAGQVTWASSNTSVATITSPGGLASAATVGSSTINALLSGIVGQTVLTVTPATLQSITVTPANPLIAKGLTQQFTATGTYTDNSTQGLAGQVTWASSNTGVATITTGGLATAATAGNSTISATLSGIVGQTVLTVTAPALVSIAVTPANPSITKGLTQQFTATGTYTDNSTQNLTSQVTWSSTITSVATITASGGLATAATVGNSTISATLSGISNSTSLTVTVATLQSIAITPANPSIAKGLTQQFTAIGTYTDQTTHDLTGQVTWASAITSVATIVASGGLATGVGAGSSSISATLSGIPGTTILTVTPPALVSIAVTPANPSIAKGLTQQFTATGTYTDSSIQNLTGQVTWTSATTSVATMTSPGGLGTGASVGASTISATLSGISSATVLTVTPATLQSIAVTPANPSIVVGTSQQFAATGTYTDRSTQTLTSQVTWASVNAGVATFGTTNGLAAGIAVGTSTIDATFGTVLGSTLLSVTPLGLCDIKGQGQYTVIGVQLMINEALGISPAVNDLNSDGVVNVAEVQVVINAAMNLGCTTQSNE